MSLREGRLTMHLSRYYKDQVLLISDVLNSQIDNVITSSDTNTWDTYIYENILTCTHIYIYMYITLAIIHILVYIYMSIYINISIFC